MEAELKKIGEDYLKWTKVAFGRIYTGLCVVLRLQV
jgi:hypothetical protein